MLKLNPGVVVFEDEAFGKLLGDEGPQHPYKGDSRKIQRKAVYEPKSGLLPDTKFPWHLDLELPSPWSCEKYVSVTYKPLRAWHFVTAAQTD